MKEPLQVSEQRREKMNLCVKEQNSFGIDDRKIVEALQLSLRGRDLKKVILIPPDYTRLNSKAGFITKEYYRLLTERGCEVDVMPALGSHMAMTKKDCAVLLCSRRKMKWKQDWRWQKSCTRSHFEIEEVKDRCRSCIWVLTAEVPTGFPD